MPIEANGTAIGGHAISTGAVLAVSNATEVRWVSNLIFEDLTAANFTSLQTG